MTSIEEIELNISDVSKKIYDINNKIGDLKNKYYNITTQFKKSIEKQNNDYLELFEKIRNLEDNDDVNVQYYYNNISNQVKNLTKQKNNIDKYELNMYRIEKELKSNEVLYEMFNNEKEKLLKIHKEADDSDLRIKCNICYNKKDNFISCSHCDKLLCLECYDNIINKINNNIIDNFVKCPYCRAVNSFLSNLEK